MDPDLDPLGHPADEYRGRLDQIVLWASRSVEIQAYKRREKEPRNFKLRRRKASRSLQNDSPFRTASRAGRDFLIATDISFEFLRWIDGLNGTGGRPSLNVEMTPEFREQMTRMIAALERYDDFVDALKAPPDKVSRAPNSKRWQHDAVFRIYNIWDSAGQSARPKKDFETFAYHALEGTRAVTPEGIRESMDRHVRPKLARQAAREGI